MSNMQQLYLNTCLSGLNQLEKLSYLKLSLTKSFKKSVMPYRLERIHRIDFQELTASIKSNK